MEPLSGTPFLGRLVALAETLERPDNDKHSSVFQTFVNYGRKKFNNIGPCPPVIKKLVSSTCVAQDT